MQLPATNPITIRALKASALMLCALVSLARAESHQTASAAIAPQEAPIPAANISESAGSGGSSKGISEITPGRRLWSVSSKELAEAFGAPTGTASKAWVLLIASIALVTHFIRRRHRSRRLQAAHRRLTPQPGKRRFEDLSPNRAVAPGTVPGTILLVVENLPVPYDRRVWQEALALKSAGFQVTVVSPATNPHRKLSEVLEGIHVYRYPMLIEGQGKFGLIFEYVWSFCCIFVWTIFVALRRGFKVIMIANPPEIFFPIMWMWRLLGKKTVFDHHDLTPELFATKFKVDRSIILSFFYFAERQMMRAVHKVVSTNDSYKAIAIRRGRRASDDVIVIRNAPDPRRFSVRTAEPELRKSAKYMLAFLGEIGQQDGVDILLRAIKTITATLGPNEVHCVLMGAGPHYDHTVAYAKELGVSDSITFTGRADNDTICRVLSSADLAVDPCPGSPHADLSTATKIMEYMFFSIPIVAFDLLETRRSGGETVCYARVDEETDLARRIIDLLQDEPRRRVLGRTARLRLDTALSWHVSARKLVTLMSDLIGAPVPLEQEELALDGIAVDRTLESGEDILRGGPAAPALLETTSPEHLELGRSHISLS